MKFLTVNFSVKPFINKENERTNCLGNEKIFLSGYILMFVCSYQISASGTLTIFRKRGDYQKKIQSGFSLLPSLNFLD